MKTPVLAAFLKNETIGIAIATVVHRERVKVLSHLLSPSSSRTLAHPALSNRRLVFSGRLFFCANSGGLSNHESARIQANQLTRNRAPHGVLGCSSTPHFLVNPTTRILYSALNHDFDFPSFRASCATQQQRLVKIALTHWRTNHHKDQSQIVRHENKWFHGSQKHLFRHFNIQNILITRHRTRYLQLSTWVIHRTKVSIGLLNTSPYGAKFFATLKALILITKAGK